VNIKKIYREFDGVLTSCPGKDCKFSQCEKASKQGVEIFPDEVNFLIKKFPKKTLNIIPKKNSFTGFIMKNCSKNKECLLKEFRPIFCRTFPVKPYFLDRKHFKISTFEKCPAANSLPSDFYAKAMKTWAVAMKKWNRNPIKKIIASFNLRH